MKTVECVVNGVKVEAGQWWMTKSGLIVYITGINPFDEEWPIQAHDAEDPDAIFVYHRDGQCIEEPESSLHRRLQYCTGFDWAGDGYRLLNVETDVAALGDERWNNYDHKWEHRSIFDGHELGKNPGDFYRRKIAVEVPAPPVDANPVTPAFDPGEGYRLLNDDDECLEGDEYTANNGLSWNLSGSHKANGGGRYSHYTYRRKLPTQRTELEYYLIPNAVNIAYIVRGTDHDSKFQTVLKSGKCCVAFDEPHTGWKKCTQQEAYDNLARMSFKPRYFVDYNWEFTAYAIQKEYGGLAKMVHKSGNETLSVRLDKSWTEVTEREALSRLDVNQHFDSDDLEEDDDDFTDLSDADDEDYDDDDRVQNVSPVTINITVNVFPAFEDDEQTEYTDTYPCDLSVDGVPVGKCSSPVVSDCCGCGSSAPLGSCDVVAMADPVNARQQGGVTGGYPSPNPGAGYRLIDKNVDSPKDGDQYWSNYFQRWENRDCMTMQFMPMDTYRRKVEPVEPVCEAGYRWLKADEVIKATDQFQDVFDKQWKNPLHSVGGIAGLNFRWRRPIKPEPAPAPVEYRMLQVGEVIEKGDEYLDLGEWDITSRPGGNVGKYQVDKYRRKIDPTKDRYFVWGGGFSCYKLVYPDGTVHSVWRDGSMNESCINPLKPDTHDSEFLEVSKDFAEAAIRNR